MDRLGPVEEEWSDSASSAASVRGAHPAPPDSPASSSSGSSFRGHFIRRPSPASSSTVQQASPDVTVALPASPRARTSPALAFPDPHTPKGAGPRPPPSAGGAALGGLDRPAGHAFRPVTHTGQAAAGPACPSTVLSFHSSRSHTDATAHSHLEVTCSSVEVDSFRFACGRSPPQIRLSQADDPASDPDRELPGVTDETPTLPSSASPRTDREEGEAAAAGWQEEEGRLASGSPVSRDSSASASTDSLDVDAIVQQAALFVGTPTNYVPRRSRSRTPQTPVSARSVGPRTGPRLAVPPFPGFPGFATPSDKPPAPPHPLVRSPLAPPLPPPVDGTTEGPVLPPPPQSRQTPPLDFPSDDVLPALDAPSSGPGDTPPVARDAAPPPPAAAAGAELPPSPSLATLPAHGQRSPIHRPPHRTRRESPQCRGTGGDVCPLPAAWGCLDCGRAYCDHCLEAAHLSPARRHHTRFEYRPLRNAPEVGQQELLTDHIAHSPAAAQTTRTTVEAVREALVVLQGQRRRALAAGREAHRAVAAASAGLRSAAAAADRWGAVGRAAEVALRTANADPSLGCSPMPLGVNAAATALVAARQETGRAAEVGRGWRAAEQKARLAALRHTQEVQELTQQMKALRHLLRPTCVPPR